MQLGQNLALKDDLHKKNTRYKESVLSSPLTPYMSSNDDISNNTHCLLVYTKAKMVGKRSIFSEQMWSSIKIHIIFGIQAKYMF